MSLPGDHYKTLGMPRSASSEQISKAYRQLVRRHHPDVNKAADAHERMAALNEAYAVLSDQEKRTAYDGVVEPFRSFQENFAQHPARGKDHHASVELNIEDAYGGADRIVVLRYLNADGERTLASEEQHLQVKVPKGVVEGPSIRLPELGGAGTGGAPAGDLLLEVRFKPDHRWRAEGRDVYQPLPISPWEAALGGPIKLMTPGGETEVDLPAEWKAGSRLKLKGLGIPGALADAPAGDLYLELELKLPTADSSDALAAYTAMAQAFPDFNPRVELSALQQGAIR